VDGNYVVSEVTDLMSTWPSTTAIWKFRNLRPLYTGAEFGQGLILFGTASDRV